jgi:hypothetical protein
MSALSQQGPDDRRNRSGELRARNVLLLDLKVSGVTSNWLYTLGYRPVRAGGEVKGGQALPSTKMVGYGEDLELEVLEVNGLK